MKMSIYIDERIFVILAPFLHNIGEWQAPTLVIRADAGLLYTMAPASAHARRHTVQFEHTSTPSKDSIPSKQKKKTNKPRFRLRWWSLIISVIGVVVVLSVFFPQILALVLLAALSAAVAKIIDRVLDRFFKKPSE